MKNEAGTHWEFEYQAKGAMRQLNAACGVTYVYPYLRTGTMLDP
jgi:hypothetical protein